MAQPGASQDVEPVMDPTATQGGMPLQPPQPAMIQ